MGNYLWDLSKDIERSHLKILSKTDKAIKFEYKYMCWAVLNSAF